MLSERRMSFAAAEAETGKYGFKKNGVFMCAWKDVRANHLSF